MEKREKKRRLTESSAVDREVVIHKEIELDTCVRDMVEDAADVISKRVSSIAIRVHNQISSFSFLLLFTQGSFFFCVPTEREAGRLSLCARLTYAVNVKLPPASWYIIPLSPNSVVPAMGRNGVAVERLMSAIPKMYKSSISRRGKPAVINIFAVMSKAAITRWYGVDRGRADCVRGHELVWLLADKCVLPM